MNSCESCESTENLIEYSQREASGGQFCGGDWWICKKCDDEAKRFAELMKSDKFKDLLSVSGINKEKYFGS